MSAETFKQELARVFDDDLHTKQWHNYVDYAIIGLILLSTLEVFLSTYDGIVEKYGMWLMVVDYLTTAFFTIEVTLRIWAADQIDPKYNGFWGRVRYCFSFYGFIDLISTYPFYLHFFMPVPYVALKTFRIARLMRIFRYIKAFGILKRAMSSKKDELLVSLEFLTIITVLLSFILFFVEHKAQPDVYDNGWTSVLWAFAQYIGDPGGFADTPPITFIGRLIACIIGVLGIAIFAVPAGLVASAFSEVMEKDAHETDSKQWAEEIRHCFKFVQCRYTKLLHTPQYVPFATIQQKYNLSIDEILAAVKGSSDLRIKNLATTFCVDEQPFDKLVVEHFMLNRPYGGFINRNSKVTIVSTSSVSEVSTGHVAYYLAKMGGFNYVSKEITQDMSKSLSYYNIVDEDGESNLRLFLDDINSLITGPDCWVVFLLSASGGEEPVYPTQFHYIVGGPKGMDNYDIPNLTVKDTATFDTMMKELSSQIETQYGLTSDLQRYHTGTNPKNIARHIDSRANAFTLRIAWSVTCRDYRITQISKTIAESFGKYFEPGIEKDVPDDMKERIVGEDYGYRFYSDTVFKSEKNKV